MASLREKLDDFDAKLAEKRAPTIDAKTVYSMEPAGLYGSVYTSPRKRSMLIACIVVGGIIGCILLGTAAMYVMDRINESTKVSEVVASLTTPVERNIPALNSVYGMSDDDIYASFSSANTLYQVSKDEAGMELLRLPSTITIDQMAAYYAEGFSKMTTDELATVLQGSWWFTTNRGTALTVKLKYADFTSGSIEMAIRNAVETQGFNGTNCTVLKSGVDDNQNTYEYGSITYEDGTVRYWRVAACLLSEVYSNDGLPAASFYVGITLASNEFVDLTETTTGDSTSSSTASTQMATTVTAVTDGTAATDSTASGEAAAADQASSGEATADETAVDSSEATGDATGDGTSEDTAG